jgi:hypothetical protein
VCPHVDLSSPQTTRPGRAPSPMCPSLIISDAPRLFSNLLFSLLVRVKTFISQMCCSPISYILFILLFSDGEDLHFQAVSPHVDLSSPQTARPLSGSLPDVSFSGNFRCPLLFSNLFISRVLWLGGMACLISCLMGAHVVLELVVFAKMPRRE